MRITLSLARCKSGNVRKSYIIGEDGALSIKDEEMWLSKGTFEVLSFDGPSDFAGFLEKFPSNSALCAGIPRNGKLLQSFGKIKERDAGRAEIARCIEDMMYGDVFPLLIDYDGGYASSPAEIWQKFTDAVPEAEGAAWVAVASSSRHIYAPDGVEVVGGGKYHLYVICSGSPARFREILKHRAGCTFDTVLMHSAALHYEAPPALPKGYTQRKPPAVVVEGGVLDLDAIPMPPPPDRAAFEPVALPDELQRMKLEEIMAHLLGCEMNPGSSTYDLWMKIINSLTNLIGADAAADYGTAIAPKRKRSEAERIARTAPRWDDPMGCLYAVAKRYGFKLSDDYRKAWGKAQKSKEIPATKSTPAAKGSAVTLSSELTPDNAPPVPPVGSLRDLCIEIAQRGIGGSELDQELIAAAQLHRVHPSAVRGMFDAVAEEVERAESRTDVLQGINSLQAALDRRLDPAAILPKPLADLMSRWADSVNIKVEGLILGLLSGISGMHHPITRFIVNEEFRVPPAIWFALLAPTGEMKTPILNKVIGEPLGHLDWKEKEIHDAKMKDWKQRRDRAKRNKEEFTEEPPVRIKLLTNDCTYEQGALQMSMQPNGINFHYDELTSLHESLKRSEHRGDILNLYNGNRISKMKVGSKEDASDRYTDVDSALAVYNGGCQIEVLKEFLARGDRDGFWARYFFSYQPSSYTPLVVATDEDEIQSDGISPLCSALIGVYSHARLLGMSPCFFRSNREAAAVYTAFNDEIEARRLAPGCPEPFAAILAKCRGSVARLAMSLQMIWDAHEGVDILNPVIGGFIMRAACEIIRYHLSQVEWVYAEAEAGGVEFLEYKLQKILEISNGQPIGVSDCKRRASAFRGLTAGKVKGMFGELVELGLGRMEGEGRTAKFVSTPREKERNQKVTSFAPQNNGRGQFGQNSEIHTGGSIESPCIGDINQINQINHPYTYTYKDNTKEPPNPLDSIPPSTPSIGGGEFGQFGQFDLKPSDNGASKMTEPVNGAVHLDRSVQTVEKMTIDPTLPAKAIARFDSVDSSTPPAQLREYIRIWGASRFDAYLLRCSEERRAFLQQQLLTETHD